MADRRSRRPREDDRSRPYDRRRSRSPPRGPRSSRHESSRHDRSDRRSPPRGHSDRKESSRRSEDRDRSYSSRKPEESKYEKSRDREKRDVKAEPFIKSESDVAMTDKPIASGKPNGKSIGEIEDEDTALMRKVMGFTGFQTTKNKKVPGNDRNWGVRKEKVMKARQYMNRTGGFNRPLSPSRI